MALDPPGRSSQPSRDNPEWPEGRHPPGDRGATAFFRATGDSIRHEVSCISDGCNWRFRETMVATLGCFERVCPRCHAKQLVVFGQGRRLASVALAGRNAGSLFDSLLEAGLTEPEAELLVDVALLDSRG